ncbi:MAG: DUF2325 domain-containing protein [Anaerovoracaceae bacterium]|jgi:hypothetical protein
MSVVIIGGNERMEGRYKDLCRKYNGKAKVFTKTKGALKKKIGEPDLMVMFTNTVSHKMVISATGEARGKRTKIVHAPSSSLACLKRILDDFTNTGASA